MKKTSKQLAIQCATIASNKKGEDIAVLDIRHITQIADYFIIATGGTDKHVRAMAEEIAYRNKEDIGEQAYRVEGLAQGIWVIVDYVDVVVHLFTDVSRKHYNLDRLWGDAKVIKRL